MKMSVGVLDHYNVSTRKLNDTVRFYEDILGFMNGPRPPFDGRRLPIDSNCATHPPGGDHLLLPIKFSRCIRHPGCRGDRRFYQLSSLRYWAESSELQFSPEYNNSHF